MHCQIAAIDDCLSEEDILLELQRLPCDLNQTYEQILKKILSKGQTTAEMARRVLFWLIGATRPMHILEIYEAVMVQPGNHELNEQYQVMDPMYILRACGSLVQSFSIQAADSLKGFHSIEDLLDQDYLEQLFPNKNVFSKHQMTYIGLSHYTVKVCV